MSTMKLKLYHSQSLIFLLIFLSNSAQPKRVHDELICSDNLLGFTCLCQLPRVNCAGKGIAHLDDISFPENATVINLSQNELSRINKGVRKKWPKTLEELRLSRNELKTVHSDSFFGLEHLAVLDLSRNNLVSLPGDLFRDLHSLETLDLSHNLIKQVSPEWFRSTAILLRLDLSYNPLGTHELPLYVNLFDFLPGLRYLDLSNCSLDFLPLDLFQNNTQLTELRLSRNPLREIPSTALYGVRFSLELLDLTSIDIEIVPNHAFHGLGALRTLVLNNLAFLGKIEALAFHALTSLETLECQNNRNLRYVDPMAFFDNISREKPNLVPRVYLSNNGLSYLSPSLLRWSETELVRLEGNPWRCDCQLAWMASDDRLSKDDKNDFLVCHEPDRLKDLPIRELAEQDFGCSANSRKLDWISLSLVVSTSLVLLLCICYMCDKRIRQDRNTNDQQEFNWQGLFHRDNLRFGYRRLPRPTSTASSASVWSLPDVVNRSQSPQTSAE